MKHSHVFNPEHAAVLETEDRKIWENPEEVLEAVEIQPDFVAADLGCGTGYFTTALARMVKKVYGIDVQKEMLRLLEDKMKKLGIRNIEPVVSKPNEIPLESDSVDLLISINTLHEFDDRAKMIEEMKRVVRKGGQILIVDFKKQDTGFGPPVEIRVSRGRAIGLFQRSGLSLLKAKDLPYHYLLVFTEK